MIGKYFADREKRPPLRELDASVKRSQAAAFAPGTLQNLTTQWVKFLSFCTFYDQEGLPASAQVLTRYVQYSSGHLKAHESMLSYLSGVKKLHISLGYPVAQFDDLMLKLTLRGLHHNNTHVPNQALPITIEILQKMEEKLNLENKEDALFWAACLMGFFLLLRKSNLVPNSSATFDGSKQLKRSDFEFFEDMAKVTLHWTKTKQFGGVPLKLALPVIPGSKLCPVNAIRRVFNMIPTGPDSHCLVKSNGSHLTYPQLQRRLKTMSEVLKLPRKLTSHSMRAGGMTSAFLAGVPSELLRQIGDFKSDCYLRYIRCPEEGRVAAGLLMKYRVQLLDK